MHVLHSFQWRSKTEQFFILFLKIFNVAKCLVFQSNGEIFGEFSVVIFSGSNFKFQISIIYFNFSSMIIGKSRYKLTDFGLKKL